jgi:HemX protein
MLTIPVICGAGICAIAAALAVFSLVRPNAWAEPASRWLMVLGCVPVIYELTARGLSTGQLPVFGKFGAMACYALGILLIHFLTAIRHRTHGMAGLIFPYATIMLVAAAPGVGIEIQSSGRWPVLWLNLHAIIARGAYALFTVASIMAVAYLIQDHNLKSKNFGTLFNRLPALETLDHLMRQQIGLAFLMLTTAIICGFIMARMSADVREWLTDPKVAATGATWVAYAVLVHVRTWADRHGRKVAIATIVAVFFVLFTFWGVNLLSESLHDFVGSGIAGN